MEEVNGAVRWPEAKQAVEAAGASFQRRRYVRDHSAYAPQLKRDPLGRHATTGGYDARDAITHHRPRGRCSRALHPACPSTATDRGSGADATNDGADDVADGGRHA